MVAWCKTEDGWAVNLDGTNAAAEFRLPRIELHSGPQRWQCVCHRENGRSVTLPLGSVGTAAAAKQVAVEAMLALETKYDAALLALLGRRTA